jgi:serine/threonine-protein kinase RsbW
MAFPSSHDEHAPGRRRSEVDGSAGAPSCRSSHRASPALGTLALTLGADLVSVSIAREKVAVWLAANTWPPANAGELVMVVSEAVSNSIEHGYGVDPDTSEHPGIVRLRARIVADEPGYRRIDMIVTDDGRWIEPSSRMQPGHGLFLIRALVAQLTIDGRTDGTTLRIRSRPAPAS